MNIYEKLQKIKAELLDCNLKKSGKNKFAGFEYYELGDIMPDIIRLCDKYKVCTVINFSENYAQLKVIDSESNESDESHDNSILISTPTAALELKGANAIQALGGVQTYMRRYLYMAMFDITENDQFDAVTGKKEESKEKKYCCEECGAQFKPFADPKMNKWHSAKDAFEQVKKKYGKAICKECREKSKNVQEELKNV
jgi:hypothetical protein